MCSEKKSIRLVALAALVILAWFSLGITVSAGEGEPAGPDVLTTNGSDPIESQVILYYFHGTRRCKTCRTIEANAEKAIGEKFKDALQEGTLRWIVLNTDEATNAHFVKDFDLYSSSLVVVEVNGDEVIRHEVLQDAWKLVRDEPRFIQYVQRSVHEYLK
jgi:hypothetical protein